MPKLGQTYAKAMPNLYQVYANYISSLCFFVDRIRNWPVIDLLLNEILWLFNQYDNQFARITKPNFGNW